MPCSTQSGRLSTLTTFTQLKENHMWIVRLTLPRRKSPTSPGTEVRITRRLMTSDSRLRSRVLLALAFAAGLVLSVLSESLFQPLVLQAHAQPHAPLQVGEVDNAQLDLA